MSIANVVSMDLESEEAHEAGDQKRNEDMETTEMVSLFKESFRVKGDVIVKHLLSNPV
jgi:hypothetical protein